ncbi:MAG: hypothetical protein JXB39_12995 [Deltaproteobacteria bacterium]|nr:hypothetical protein [Deltaproteobacteria bacterium]
MWFTHLYYALGTHPTPGPDRDRLVWGALAPDVDKVWPVSRAITHAHGLPRPVRAADLLAALGVTLPSARGASAFLAGWASHVAVDTAWYRHLRRLVAARPDLAANWTDATTRAWNLALDLEAREHVDPRVVDIEHADGDEVVPCLSGPAGRTLRTAVAVYLAWQGRIEDPAPLGLAPVLERFRSALRHEGMRVEALLSVLDRTALDDEVLQASRAAAQDVYACLGR